MTSMVVFILYTFTPMSERFALDLRLSAVVWRAHPFLLGAWLKKGHTSR